MVRKILKGDGMKPGVYFNPHNETESLQVVLIHDETQCFKLQNNLPALITVHEIETQKWGRLKNVEFLGPFKDSLVYLGEF